MPYGRSYRKKAKRAFKKVVNKRVAKRLVRAYRREPHSTNFESGLMLYKSADMQYNYIKNYYKARSDNNNDLMGSNNSESIRGGRRKRYGIDDWW
jgi:hypothetical protein